MENGVSGSSKCWHCRQISSVTPNTEYVRCHGCRRVFSIFGDHKRNNHSISSEVNNSSSQEIETIKNGSKGFCHGFRKRFTGSRNYDQTMNGLAITSMPQPKGNKRALICGVTYKKEKFKLKGTANDVENMKSLLIQQFDFQEDSILVLAENESSYAPTKKNIEDAFKWLMKGIKSGDSLVFYFSGHGKREREFDGDEVDGFDETICPVDFHTNGMIKDNDINKAIVKPLIPGVTLHAIVDACHSGTILDLPYVYEKDMGKWVDNSPPSGAFKGTSGGIAICFSACEDYQLAADTSDLSPDKEMTGAMTSTFIKAVKEAMEINHKITYQEILDSMHETLNQPQKLGFLSATIRRFFHRKILQDPLLSSSEEFDTNTQFSL